MTLVQGSTWREECDTKCSPGQEFLVSTVLNSMREMGRSTSLFFFVEVGLKNFMTGRNCYSGVRGAYYQWSKVR